MLLIRASTLLAALCLVGCASSTDKGLGGHDCNKTLCGCQVDNTKTIRLQYVDEESKSAWGVKLVCLDNYESFGTTGPKGIIRLKVEGATSPGCGFQPDCTTAFFISKDQGRERPFWTRELLSSGNEIESDGRKAVVLDVSD